MSLEEKLRRAAGWAALLVCILGLVAFAGSIFGVDALGPIRPAGAPMKVSTALCFMLAGASLWLQHRGRYSRAGVACAAVAGVIAGATLLETIFNLNPGFDPLIPSGHLVPEDANHPDRMPLQTALALFVLAVALMFLRWQRGPRRWPISTWLANMVVATAAAAVVARGLVDVQGIAHTYLFGFRVSGPLFLLGVGTLLARPEDTHTRVLFDHGASGALARRLFFGVALLPILFTALVTLALRWELLNLTEGMFTLAIAFVMTGVAVSLFSIKATARIHHRSEESEQTRLLLTARLQDQAAQLQETIGLRTRELRDANEGLRAAADSNALLALVAQNTTNSVIITDAQGRIEWVNTAFTRTTGYELDEIKGRKPGQFLQGPDTDPKAVARLREAEQRGEPCHVEILNYTKQGTPFWQTIDMQPVRDRTGRVVNFVANETDITDQRRAKVGLQHLNQRLELATRSVAIGVWEWDPVTQTSFWDERSLEIYGVSAAEFKGTRADWSRRLHPEDHDRAMRAVQAVLAGANHYDIDFRIVRANDGAVRHLESRAIVQRDAQGNLLRMIGTERDVTPEREATQQMQALNERLRLALRSSNYGVWEIDVGTGRRNWDGRMFEIYGLAPEEFGGSGEDWPKVLHPEDRAAALERVQRVIAGELPGYDDEYRIVRPDGILRHVEAHGYLQRDASGRAMRLVGLIRDITEQKQMEQALNLAEQRWQLAIEGSNDSVWDWDIETGTVFHDQRWCHMLGYDADELPQTIESWKKLVHPDDLAANEAAIREHFEQRTSFYQDELRMRAKNNEWRWILDRGKVVRRAPDGRPIRMAGTHSDVTARKKLEERLRMTEGLAREVSRLAQIGGWEIDLVNSRVIWNDGTRRIHEVDDNFEPTLESVWQFFPPEALATVQAALRDASPSSPSFDVEVPLLTACGRRVWVRMLGHGEFSNGTATMMRGAIQDITGRHESEEARRELETQLFQAQKMETLGTLAGGIAHDFNNLLTGIIGYHELAADMMPEDHQARSFLNEARNASLRARELVEQILTFGRHKTSTEHGPVDLALVVEEARRFLRATLPANITIDVHCGPDCESVLGDATQIHQVLLNLGSNAAHAMRHNGGALRISLESAEITSDLVLSLGGTPANGYIRISVSDTGHGMDEPTRRRIFDPFFTTKKTREGTGLGLAVVHGIVRAHRGAIDVESKPGRGSTFHIYLPTAGHEQAQMESDPEMAPRGAGEFICVVDDEEVVGSCTKLVLESKGYRTLIFGSAEHCLAEMETHPDGCAVLLTDQTMPGMQGTELAVAMRRINPSLPIVIMSGYFSKISPAALDELGQVELLAKPFTTDELAHAVHRALHSAVKMH